jgi:hypothetical protein
MKKMDKLIVGQTLWFVYYNSYSNSPRPGCEVTITKIGRKWIGLNNGHRVDKHTLYADGRGYSSPGRCYPSREHHETQVEIRKAWRDFSNSIDPRNPPDGASLESIAQAIRLLNLENAA